MSNPVKKSPEAIPGDTALHAAVLKGDKDLVSKLLKLGMRVRHQNDIDGSTPMHW